MVYQRIADYMRSHGVTQAHICRETGLGTNAVSSILKGERKISVEEYIAICDALGVQLDHFRD